MSSENIVKKVCKELGITQKELAERIGVAEGTVNRWSAKPDTIPEQTIKMFELLLENKRLKEKEEKVNTIFKLLEDLKNS